MLGARHPQHRPRSRFPTKKAAQGPGAQRLSAGPAAPGRGKTSGTATAPRARLRTEQRRHGRDGPVRSSAEPPRTAQQGAAQATAGTPELRRPGQALTPHLPPHPQHPAEPRPRHRRHLLGIRAAREPSLQPAHNFQHRLRHFYCWTGRGGGSGFTSHSPHGASRPPPPSCLRAGSGSCALLPPSAAAMTGEGRARWAPSWGLAWRWRVRHLECWQSDSEGQRGSQEPRSARAERRVPALNRSRWECQRRTRPRPKATAARGAPQPLHSLTCSAALCPRSPRVQPDPGLLSKAAVAAAVRPTLGCCLMLAVPKPRPGQRYPNAVLPVLLGRGGSAVLRARWKHRTDDGRAAGERGAVWGRVRTDCPPAEPRAAQSFPWTDRSDPCQSRPRQAVCAGHRATEQH